MFFLYLILLLPNQLETCVGERRGRVKDTVCDSTKQFKTLRWIQLTPVPHPQQEPCNNHGSVKYEYRYVSDLVLLVRWQTDAQGVTTRILELAVSHQYRHPSMRAVQNRRAAARTEVPAG